jgi:hypothetical protein
MSTIKNFFLRLRNIYGRLGHDPSYDWYFALSFFFIGIVVAVLVDGFILLNLTKEVIQDDPGGNSTLTLESEDIAKAIEIVQKDDARSAVIPEAIKKDPSR